MDSFQNSTYAYYMFEILNLTSEKGSFLSNKQLSSMGKPACIVRREKYTARKIGVRDRSMFGQKLDINPPLEDVGFLIDSGILFFWFGFTAVSRQSMTFRSDNSSKIFSILRGQSFLK